MIFYQKKNSNAHHEKNVYIHKWNLSYDSMSYSEKEIVLQPVRAQATMVSAGNCKAAYKNVSCGINVSFQNKGRAPFAQLHCVQPKQSKKHASV